MKCGEDRVEDDIVSCFNLSTHFNHIFYPTLRALLPDPSSQPRRLLCSAHHTYYTHLSEAMPVKIAKSEHQASKRRYKHTMRKSPYLISLILLLAATTLTLLNIYVSSLLLPRLFPCQQLLSINANHGGRS